MTVERITIGAAAKRLGVSYRTVWRQVRNGWLPAVQVGRAVRIDPADLERFELDYQAARGRTAAATLPPPAARAPVGRFTQLAREQDRALEAGGA